MQPAVIAMLNSARIPCYDFKNPEGGTGFHWSEVMSNYTPGSESANVDEYLNALVNPRSIEGFNSDFAAMQKADTFILVLPCGRSAHLELGWAVGAGKRTAIFLDPDNRGHVTPELMYKMCDLVTYSSLELLDWLGVED
jgi:hypothetical protein